MNGWLWLALLMVGAPIIVAGTAILGCLIFSGDLWGDGPRDRPIRIACLAYLIVLVITLTLGLSRL